MNINRLSPDDWTNAGLKALATSGFTTLKADTLSKALGVSRGSFYWHFSDVGAFHAAVLKRWREVAYDNIVEGVEGAAPDRLRALLSRAFRADTHLERAVRAWATSEAMPRGIVEAMDATRLQYIQSILAGSGVHADRTMTRARIIYWAYLGHVLSAGELPSDVSDQVLDDLACLARAQI